MIRKDLEFEEEYRKAQEETQYWRAVKDTMIRKTPLENGRPPQPLDLEGYKLAIRELEKAEKYEKEVRRMYFLED